MNTGKPRVIRRVIRWTRATKKNPAQPKAARDRKAMIEMERIKARAPRPCAYQGCPYPNHIGFSKVGIIETGAEYAKVSDYNRSRRIGKNIIAETKDYHFMCVPEIARPLVRFFLPGEPVMPYDGTWNQRKM